MIFDGFLYYFVFLIPAAIVYRVVPLGARAAVCVAAGLPFFVYYSLQLNDNWWAAACVLIFFWEAMLARLYAPRSIICLFGNAVSLAVLFVFKYWNFATGAVTDVFLPENPWHWQTAFLPLGVSFFTFEFIHYATDRYRGKVERGTLGEYLAFIFFFPTMVAGPIKRFQDFVVCLRDPTTAWAVDWNRGLTRILCGLVKKMLIADFLTSLTDHLQQSDIAVANRGTLLLWLFAYGWKIYFDFSAYSDIAIGSGRLFGIRIPENFDWPYFRRNIAQFWQHWHISLYRWLVDYLFIPLGGSRGSLPFVCRNIMLVMLASGIWHGAGLNFIVWGLWHGTLLVIHRLWTSFSWSAGTTLPPDAGDPQNGSYLGGLLSWLLTYVCVNLGWAFFAMDFDTAVFFFRRLLLQ